MSLLDCGVAGVWTIDLETRTRQSVTETDVCSHVYGFIFTSYGLLISCREQLMQLRASVRAITVSPTVCAQPSGIISKSALQSDSIIVMCIGNIEDSGILKISATGQVTDLVASYQYGCYGLSVLMLGSTPGSFMVGCSSVEEALVEFTPTGMHVVIDSLQV